MAGLRGRFKDLKAQCNAVPLLYNDNGSLHKCSVRHRKFNARPHRYSGPQPRYNAHLHKYNAPLRHSVSRCLLQGSAVDLQEVRRNAVAVKQEDADSGAGAVAVAMADPG